MNTLVAGIDSSTQSCKVVIREAETGQLVRRGSATVETRTAMAILAADNALAVLRGTQPQTPIR